MELPLVKCLLFWEWRWKACSFTRREQGRKHAGNTALSVSWLRDSAGEGGFTLVIAEDVQEVAVPTAVLLRLQ